MLPTKKYIPGMIVGCILLIMIMVIIWLKPQSPSISSPSTATLQHDAKQVASLARASSRPVQALMSNSQQDTQINCQIQIDQANRLIINEQTKNCFEYFISQYGEKPIAQIKLDFLAYIQVNYQDPAQSQLADLWGRYLQYRNKLGDLQAPNIPQDDPKYYRSIMTKMQNLRKQFFSAYEIEGLFGPEDVYNDYTLDRLDILDNKNLSAAEKAKALKDLFDKLPDDWKQNLQQLHQLEDLRQLTADIKARGGSTEELHQMRINLVGTQATQRLEKLDVQRNDWKNRVNQYLSERDNIIKSSLSDAAKHSALSQLKSQQFSNPQEQLRLQAFESIHDQGGKPALNNDN